jgi:hypothetical protein
MKNGKIVLFIVLTTILLVHGIYYVFGGPTTADGAPYPISWNSYDIIQNYTFTSPIPESLNKTRSFIYEVDLVMMQVTHRWIGYVGNISGNISLMDNNRNALYSWNIAITSGEIYATRFNGRLNGGQNNEQALVLGGQVVDGVGPDNTDYDYVDWTNVLCAARDAVENESIRLGHNITVDNDALTKTFLNNTNFRDNAMEFDVADMHIDISTGDNEAGGCSGTFLNTYPNEDQTEYWQMVVLEDGTTDQLSGDLIFASIIENSSVGFNNATYDFQIILPQYGQVLKGTADNDIKPNIAYYFYVELIGEGWPSTTT